MAPVPSDGTRRWVSDSPRVVPISISDRPFRNTVYCIDITSTSQKGASYSQRHHRYAGDPGEGEQQRHAHLCWGESDHRSPVWSGYLSRTTRVIAFSLRFSTSFCNTTCLAQYDHRTSAGLSLLTKSKQFRESCLIALSAVSRNMFRNGGFHSFGSVLQSLLYHLANRRANGNT
jgi:hypothetical protein